MDENQSVSAGNSVLPLIIYWTVVGVPLAWGVYNTVLKVRALFS